MGEQKSKVSFEEVKPIFEHYKYWCKDDEYYWYENMWQILDRRDLTSYENEEQHREIILMAVALVIMFTDHIALKYDECDLHDCFYSNVVSGMISEYDLESTYHKYAEENDEESDKEYDNESDDENDDVHEDHEYMVVYLADIMRRRVYKVLRKELGATTLFLSMEAVDRGMKQEVLIKEEDEEYYDEEDFEPESAKEFWDVFKKNEEDIADEIDNYYLDMGSTMYGWVESGCPQVL